MIIIIKFCTNIEFLMALTFVPIHHVIDAYEEIIQSQFFIESVDVFNESITYFEHTWIGERCQIRYNRKKPLFNILLWNCYEDVINDSMRSNNSVEGWHNSFNRKAGVNHAIHSFFIDVIKS